MISIAQRSPTTSSVRAIEHGNSAKLVLFMPSAYLSCNMKRTLVGSVVSCNPLLSRGDDMPLVHVTVPEGTLSDTRKQLMVEKITAAALEAEGLPDNDRTRMLTWVIINEVKDGNW